VVVYAQYTLPLEQAAGALRISRALAAFHLDKLVQQGLLDAGARGTRAELRAPEAGSCCVVLKTSHTKR
jgi:predicted ArsR family transcriptional regulator